MIATTRTWILIAAAAVGTAAVTASTASEFWRFMIGRYCVLVIVVMGVKLLLGVGGVLSVASSAFFGMGAYGVTIANRELGLGLLAALPLVIGVAWLVSMILGTASIRLKGFYLAIVTLGFVQLFDVLLRQGGAITGRSSGLITPAFSLPLLGRISPEQASNLAVASSIILAALVSGLVRSQFGRALYLVKHNDVAAVTCGVSPSRIRLVAFGLSGVLAAYAGVINSLLLGVSVPEAYDIDTSIEFLAFTVLGGIDGAMLGAFVGTAIPYFVPELVPAVSEWDELFFGVLLLATLVLAPNGVVRPISRLLRTAGPASLRARISPRWR